MLTNVKHFQKNPERTRCAKMIFLAAALFLVLLKTLFAEQERLASPIQEVGDREG